MKKRELTITVLSVFIVVVFVLSMVYLRNGNLTGFSVLSANSQSVFNNGTYANTIYNGSAIVLSGSNTSGIYTSKVFDAESAAKWNSILWNNSDAKLNLSVRSCDDSACSGESWTNIADVSPQNLNIANNTYFQFKFEFTSGDPAPVLSNVYVDYTILNPNVSLTSPSSGNYSNNTNVTLKYTPSDSDLSNCALWGNFNGSFGLNKTDGFPTNGAENSFNLTLSNGAYIWNVKCTDSAGNTAFAIANYTLTVDNVIPNVTISEPTGTKVNRNGIPLVFSVSDATPTICNYNVYKGSDIEKGNTTVSCGSGSTTFNVATYSSFIVNFYATDSAGNVNSASGSFIVTESSITNTSTTNLNDDSEINVVYANIQKDLKIEDLGKIILIPNNNKTIDLKIRNNGTSSFINCSIAGRGDSVNLTKFGKPINIKLNENVTMSFIINSPVLLNKSLDIYLECSGRSRKLDLNIVFSNESLSTSNTLMINVSNIYFKSTKELIVEYYTIGSALDNTNLNFSVQDENGKNIVSKVENVVIDSNKKDTTLDISKAKKGSKLSIYIEDQKDNKLMAEKLFVYSSNLVTGQAANVGASVGKTISYIAIIIVIALAITFLVLRKKIKLENIKWPLWKSKSLFDSYNSSTRSFDYDSQNI